MDSNLMRQTLALRPYAPLIMNLGLGPRGAQGGGPELIKLMCVYTPIMRALMVPGYRMEVQDAKTEDDEPTLVVQGFFNELANTSDLLARMVIDAEQDCISIWYQDTGEGILFGPNVAPWEPFYVALFKSPIINAIPQ